MEVVQTALIQSPINDRLATPQPQFKMLVPVFAAALLSLALSCQNIRITAQDGSVVVGRSLEFSELPVDAGNWLWTEPAETTHTMPKLPNCNDKFEFISNFKVARFQIKLGSVWANTTLGGINDAGLTASTLYFTDYAEFKDAADIRGKACQNAVPQTQVSTYVLAKYKNVRDLKKDLKDRKFPRVWNQEDLGQDTIPVHFVFTDKIGQGLVLEYTKDGMKFFDNSVGAMTNSPDYKWHMTNLRNYPQLQRKEWKGFQYTHLGEKYTLDPKWVGTGFTGLPGDYSSPSRFVKAATMVTHSGKAKDADTAVTRMFHMMNAADIPKGILDAGTFTNGEGKKVKHVDYTWWISVYDLSRKCVYYRGYTDLSVKRVCLEGIPDKPSCIEVDGKFEDGFKDTTNELKSMVETEVSGY
jgi:choloylglycine hydrolase